MKPECDDDPDRRRAADPGRRRTPPSQVPCQRFALGPLIELFGETFSLNPSENVTVTGFSVALYATYVFTPSFTNTAYSGQSAVMVGSTWPAFASVPIQW